MSDDDAHIYFSFDDNPNDADVSCNCDIINEIMNDINSMSLNSDISFPHMINYSENSTVKELLLICDYYGFAK